MKQSKVAFRGEADGWWGLLTAFIEKLLANQIKEQKLRFTVLSVPQSRRSKYGECSRTKEIPPCFVFFSFMAFFISSVVFKKLVVRNFVVRCLLFLVS